MLRGSLFKWPWGPFSCCRYQLKQQIWALRPGLDGGVPALHDNTKKREGWRIGDKRWLIAPTATSKLGAGRARPLGGAKGLSGAACGVSLGGSG